MGRHRILPEHRRDAEHVKGPADLRRARSVGAVATIQPGRLGTARQEVDFWRDARQEVEVYRAKEAWLKDTFQEGLVRLVERGRYSERVMGQLPYMRLTPFVDGETNDPNFAASKDVHAYVDSQGRFIATRNLDKIFINFHELAHRILGIGDKRRFHVFREPIVNHVALDVTSIMRVGTPVLDIYQPHSRALGRIVAAANLTPFEITDITSGHNPTVNEEEFNGIVESRLGWDAAGYAQREYVTFILMHGGGNDQIYPAAARVDNLLMQEFGRRGQLVTQQ